MQKLKYINLFILGFLTYHIFDECGCKEVNQVSKSSPYPVQTAKPVESVKTTIGDKTTLKEDCGCH